MTRRIQMGNKDKGSEKKDKGKKKNKKEKKQPA